MDQGLARTLTALSTGLQGYHRQIEEFHTRMDEGLKRSVESLTAVATSLEGMVEDLTDRTPQRPELRR